MHDIVTLSTFPLLDFNSQLKLLNALGRKSLKIYGLERPFVNSLRGYIYDVNRLWHELRGLLYHNSRAILHETEKQEIREADNALDYVLSVLLEDIYYKQVEEPLLAGPKPRIRRPLKLPYGAIVSEDDSFLATLMKLSQKLQNLGKTLDPVVEEGSFVNSSTYSQAFRRVRYSLLCEYGVLRTIITKKKVVLMDAFAIVNNNFTWTISDEEYVAGMGQQDTSTSENDFNPADFGSDDE